MFNALLTFVIVFSACAGAQASTSNSFERSQSFTFGHQTQKTFEIGEYSHKAAPAYALKVYQNGQLVAGAALTKMTYEQIKKDWSLVLPSLRKKPAAATTCGESVRIKKTIKDGVQNEILCADGWQKPQKLRFHSFTKKIQELASGKTPYYEKM